MSAVGTMSTTVVWLHIVVLAVATYAIRSSFIGLFSYFDMPAPIEKHLDLVAPAVLAGLAVPPLVFRDGGYHLSPTNPFLVAGVVAPFAAI